MAIEAPINVSPDNETVYIDKTLTDPTQPWSGTNDYINPLIVKFTFNGDNLSWYRAEFYDNITGGILGYSHAPRTRIPWNGRYRNGDEVEINSQVATNLYENGNDYKYRFILYQADSNGNPLCDMLCVTGRVVEASGTSITVEKGITDIDDPYTVEDDEHNVYTVGYCMIEVVSDNGAPYRNKIKINNYNKSTGVITLDEAFVGNIAAGTRYKIYRNYYKTPCYFVRCRDKATITPRIAINEATGGIELTATWAIDSEKEVSLQKYRWSIGSYSGREIYSYHDKNALPGRSILKPTLDAVFPLLANRETTATVTTTSQDGYVQSEEVTLSNYIQRDNNMCTVAASEIAEGEYRSVYTSGLAMLLDKNRVAVKATAASGYSSFKLWKRHGSSGYYRYVSECTLSGTTVTGYDNAAEDGLNYEYALSAEINNNIVYKPIGTITPDYSNRVVIHKLSRVGEYFGLTKYDAADSFIFDFELGKPSISINDGQAVINTGAKPIVIKESGRYLSGDFSAAITQMQVNGYSYDLKDSNETFERALGFFDNSEYLLKIPDRGCIVAKITNKSLKKNEAGVTILSFNFTQVAEADEVIV